MTAAEKIAAMKTEADQIVFKLGGWLSVANRLQTTPDSLRRGFTSVVGSESVMLRLRPLLGEQK